MHPTPSDASAHLPLSAPCPICVLIADDHVIVRRGLRDFLESDPALQVIAEAGDGLSAWQLVCSRPPDVALLDIRMPGLTGIELTRRIKADFPQVRVLVFTIYDDEPTVLALLRAGADGYLLKSAQGRELIRAVKEVVTGANVPAPAVAGRVLARLEREPPLEPLSVREVEVLCAVAKGWSNRTVAQMLRISDRTVQGHLAKLFRKLHAASRTEVVTIALQHGLITLADTVG